MCMWPSSGQCFNDLKAQAPEALCHTPHPKCSNLPTETASPSLSGPRGTAGLMLLRVPTPTASSSSYLPSPYYMLVMNQGRGYSPALRQPTV